MLCPSCGFEAVGGARFCQECGASLAAPTCSGCRAELPAGAKFCPGCGTPAAGPARDVRQTPERDPRDYTPKHLADKILHSKSALEGERKQVTVLFADVKGSMDLSESVDAEEWHGILDRFFSILADGVHRFEGTVNQYTGDGIMALFGAPIAHEDHAQRACWSALHLRDALRTYAQELRRDRGLDFAVRMGINSGDVVVGKIGDDLRMDYTALGHTVGLAARMESLAESGAIYVSQDTADLVEGWFELEDLGDFNVKGVSEPTRVHALRGPGRVRTRLDVSRARGFSKFVGRVDEMATLEAALERTDTGQGQVVGVVAEAGTGKSRLCFEFLEQCRTRGYRVLQSHCVAHGSGVPFLPMVGILRQLFGISDADDDETARNKIAGLAIRLDETLSDLLPILFDFMNVPDPNRPAPAINADAYQRQIFALTRRLMTAVRAPQATVVLIEDLHWIDDASEAQLANLVDAMVNVNTMLVVNFRPQYRADWMQKTYYRRIPLVPLGPEAVAELLATLLGSDASLAGLAQRIHARTAGNPFFVEEVVQSLVEAGNLEGASGDYRLVRAVGETAVPATVQAVLAARIDRLREREKRVLQTASVIGKSFGESVLKRVTALDEGDVDEALRALVAAEFLYEQAIYPAVEYAFKHPLTQEVAYRSQLGESRARIHGEVAKAMLELHADELEDQASVLAHHWQEAGNDLEAARWFRRAAVRTGRGDVMLARAHWERVRALAASAPTSPETVQLGLESRFKLLEAAWQVGVVRERIVALLDEARELARGVEDPIPLAKILMAYSQSMQAVGDRAESRRTIEEASQLAAGTDDEGLKCALQLRLAGAHFFGGSYPEAVAIMDRTIDAFEGDVMAGAELIGFSPYIGLLWFRAHIAMSLGDPAEPARGCDRAIELAQEHGDSYSLMLALAYRAGEAWKTGDADRGAPYAMRALELAERLGSVNASAIAQEAHGQILMVQGKFEAAVEALERGLEGHRHVGWAMAEPRNLALLSEAQLGAGDVRAARETAERGMELAARNGDCVAEARLAIGLAAALMKEQGLAARKPIEAALGRAHTVASENRLETIDAFLQLEHAELARLLDDEDERRRRLGLAEALFHEIGAPLRAEAAARVRDA